MFSAGMEGAFSFRMSALVLAGFATTSTCTDEYQTSELFGIARQPYVPDCAMHTYVPLADLVCQATPTQAQIRSTAALRNGQWQKQ